MTDEQMDARLRAAGERWRGAQAPAVIESEREVTEFEVLPRTDQHRGRRWVVAASAAAIVVGLAVAGVLLATQPDGSKQSPAAPPVPALTDRAWYVPGFTAVTVGFTPTTVHYSDGCSAGTRTVEIAARELHLGKPVGRLSNCGGAASGRGALSFHLPQLLTGTVRFTVADNRLTLVKPGVGTVRLLGVDRSVQKTLDAHNWQLQQIVDGQGHSSPVVRTARLRMHGATFRATDGCTLLAGSVIALSKVLTFDTTSAPQNSCGGSQVDRIDTMLDGTVQYDVSGDRLTLRDRKGQLVYGLATAQPEPDAALDHSWQLTGTEVTVTHGNSGSGSGSSAVGNSELTIEGDGAFRVDHRCSIVLGTIAVARSTITISDLATKPHKCAVNSGGGAAESREDAFVDNLLTGTLHWSIDGKTLTLSKGDSSATFDRT